MLHNSERIWSSEQQIFLIFCFSEPKPQFATNNKPPTDSPRQQKSGGNPNLSEPRLQGGPGCGVLVPDRRRGRGRRRESAVGERGGNRGGGRGGGGCLALGDRAVGERGGNRGGGRGGGGGLALSERAVGVLLELVELLRG
jgi:hypothetical protein